MRRAVFCTNIAEWGWAAQPVKCSI